MHNLSHPVDSSGMAARRIRRVTKSPVRSLPPSSSPSGALGIPPPQGEVSPPGRRRGSLGLNESAVTFVERPGDSTSPRDRETPSVIGNAGLHCRCHLPLRGRNGRGEGTGLATGDSLRPRGRTPAVVSRDRLPSTSPCRTPPPTTTSRARRRPSGWNSG